MTFSKKLLLLSGLFSGIFVPTFSQQTQTIIPQEATIIAEEDTLTEDIEKLPTVEAFIPTANPDEVRERLIKLQREIPLTYNSTVHSFVDFFIYKKPSFTKTMLERKNFYFPIYEKYLAKYNMPDELKYLSMIESGLNPKAISRSKAVGLWQFMTKTAKLDFGLRIDEYVDERMHIEKATDAACRYLRQLYRIFGDWELALASYNTGPGNVRRAIRRAGNITNYWQLHPYLHRDTRSYVPQFTAILYMMHHADSYGIFPEEIQEYVPTRTVYVDGYLNLEAFANASGIALEDIQKFNPHLQKDHLPNWSRGMDILIPEDKYAYFEANRQMILDSAQKQAFPEVLLADKPVGQSEPGVIVINGKGTALADNDETVVEDINPTPVKAEEDVKKIRTVKKKIYKVKKGDMLNRIADKFDVEVYDIKVWNKLKSSKIVPGQKLAIYLDDEENTLTVERTIAAEKKKKKEIEKTQPKIYTVKRGDTLWSISQRYGGISIEKIKKLNKLKGNSVKAGQKLKISA